MNLDQDKLLIYLQEMDEYEFEKLVADVWEQQGWKTTVTTGSIDRGIDIIAEKETPFSQKHLIQAKRYSAGNKIGSPDIQQYSSLRHQEDDVDAIIVVTTSSFSTPAQQTANKLNVKLIDGENLCKMIFDLSSQQFLSAYFDTGTTVETTKEKYSNIIIETVKIKTDLLPAYKMKLREELVDTVVELGATYEYKDNNLKVVYMYPKNHRNNNMGLIKRNTNIQFVSL